MTMRRHALISVAAFLPAILLLRPGLQAAPDAGPVLPEATAVDRYQPIWTRAPFTVASAADDPATGGTWALVGLAENGDSPLVFLLNRQSQERMTVTGQTNEKGFSVDSVDARANILQSIVRIKTPSETLSLRFDPSVLAVTNAPPPMPMPARGPGIPQPGPFPAGGMPFTNGVPRQIIIPRTIIPNPLPKPAGGPTMTPHP